MAIASSLNDGLIIRCLHMWKANIMQDFKGWAEVIYSPPLASTTCIHPTSTLSSQAFIAEVVSCWLHIRGQDSVPWLSLQDLVGQSDNGADFSFKLLFFICSLLFHHCIMFTCHQRLILQATVPRYSVLPQEYLKYYFNNCQIKWLILWWHSEVLACQYQSQLPQ